MISDRARDACGQSTHSVGILNGDALGAVLHCPASSWQRALESHKRLKSELKLSTGDTDAVEYLLHMVQVPAAAAAVDVSEQERCGHVMLPSGLYDRAHLQEALASTSSIVSPALSGHERSISSAGGMALASAPRLPDAAGANGHGAQAEPDGSSRAALTGAVSSYEVLLMACMCGDTGVVRELLALTGDRRVDVHADDE